METSDPLPISALQHWAYCPRQCGLIHVEQAFDDDLHTLRGQAVHGTVDQPGVEVRAGLRIERALPLWNDALGLIGKSDVVEFEANGTPYPVEYKHGSRHKAADIAACDDVQLAAQALCLEEMTKRPVPEGALYYASSRRTAPSTAPCSGECHIHARNRTRSGRGQAQEPAPRAVARRARGETIRR